NQTRLSDALECGPGGEAVPDPIQVANCLKADAEPAFAGPRLRLYSAQRGNCDDPRLLARRPARNRETDRREPCAHGHGPCRPAAAAGLGAAWKPPESGNG